MRKLTQSAFCVCCYAMLLFSTGVAHAGTIVINNGGAPPNPANIIATYLEDDVYVRNAGCPSGGPGANPDDPCDYVNANPDYTTVQFGGAILGSNRLAALDSSRINSGGTVYNMASYDSAEITISGGFSDNVGAWDSSTITMSGGTNEFLHAHDSSTITVSGGNLNVLFGTDTSVLTMYGGTKVDSLLSSGSSTVTMSDGVAYWLTARESSVVTMSGGSVSFTLLAYDSADVTVSGGAVGIYMAADDSSVITVVGSGFAVDGNPVPFGNLTALNGTLTGTLASGDILETGFIHGGSSGYTGTIRLVPEPSTASLLTLGLVGIAVGKRRSSTR